MLVVMKTLLILAMLSIPACAQLPDAPSATPKKFWALTGIYAGGIVADTVTTQQFQQVGCVEAANPFLYGRRPGAARFVAISSGLFLTETLIARKMVRSRNRYWRWAGYTVIGYESRVRWQSALHNMQLNRARCQ